MIRKQINLIQGHMGKPDAWYVDDKDGTEYRRIHGGLQLPGNNPGAIVVLGEELNVDAVLGERPIRLLAEYENRHPTELIRRCGELKALLQIEEVFGDRNNRSVLAILESSNAQFSLSNAPLIDDPNVNETYLLIIREKTSSGNRVLRFGGNSTLPSKLSTIVSIPPGNALQADFPHIAALGYALSSLVLSPYQKPLYHPEMTYRPLDHDVGI